MPLSFHAAMTIVCAAVAAADASQEAVDVAVVDAGGRLIAFNRMDGAEPVGAVGAPGKASLSTAFAAPSGELREAAEEPWARALLDMLGVQVMVWSGAEPIFRDGELVGAIGVAGAGPNDHNIALAALASAGLSHTANT